MGKPNFCYIGPNVPPIGLKKFTLYRGEELPRSLEPLVKQRPVLAALYVSTRDLAAAQRRLAQKGTLEHTAAQEMLTIAKTIPR